MQQTMNKNTSLVEENGGEKTWNDFVIILLALQNLSLHFLSQSW